MMQEFDFETLENATIECEDCGWRGKGYETEKGYAALPQAIEIYCPVCRHYFGQVSGGSNGQPPGSQM